MRALGILLGVLFLAAFIAVPAYFAGVGAGLAGVAVPAVASAAPGTVVTAHWYGYGGPWHFFGFLFPLLFLFLFFGLIRACFGGWGGGRREWSAETGVPRRIEEWHRRLHDEGPSGGTGTKA